MTDYGRGSGSAPWHPEDPLYGDQGWGGQQVEGDPQYPGVPHQQYYPQQPQQHDYAHQQGYAEQQPYGQQQYDQDQQYAQQPQDPYAPQGYDPYQQYYPQQPYQDGGGEPGRPQGFDPYAQQQQLQQQAYADPRFGQQQYAQRPYEPPFGDRLTAQQPQQYAGQGQGGHDPYRQTPPQDPAYDGEWDGGNRPGIPFQAPSPHDPQTGYPQDGPGGYGQQPYDEQAGGGDHRGREPEEPAAPEPPGGEWADPPEETHPFFTGEDAPADRGGRRGRGAARHEDAYDDAYDEDQYADAERRGGKKKGRSGVACLVVVVVLVAGVGGVGYFGHSLYEERFGPPPDFAGDGTGSVQVDVPDGASGSEIAQLLVKDGVVKSAGAFVVAQGHNPEGNTIQAGAYLLKKGMSGKSAVALMLDPHSHDNLIIGEGWRDTKIYAAIDKRLGLPAGTTQGVAKKDYKTFGLPAWADASKNIKDPLEGFLYPSSYPVAKGAKPQDVLKAMVAQANAVYGRLDLESEAQKLGLKNPWQVITVASLVQAEGKTTDDFRKMAEVVYNRISPSNTQTNQYLQFDSTYNYLMGQSNIHISESAITQNHDPYNTYTNKGLPPGPIDNPGQDALNAALDPTHDGWLYFVATDGVNKTQFAKTYPEFLKLKAQFNDH